MLKRMQFTGIMAAVLWAAAGTGQAQTKPDEAWTKLKSLAGEWDAKTSEMPKGVRIVYEVVSDGHALVETMKIEGEHADMVTIYHRDGEALLATHYCSAGNQPRMRAAGLSPDGKRLVFQFQDITNLKSADAHHIRGVAFSFVDADHVRQEWSSRGKGKDTTGIFELSRKK